jgi:hypothetical protein
MSNTREKHSWQTFRGNCNNPGAEMYERYKAAGVDYDRRWDDFKVFLAEIGPCPSSRHQLKRLSAGWTASDAVKTPTTQRKKAS